MQKRKIKKKKKKIVFTCFKEQTFFWGRKKFILNQKKKLNLVIHNFQLWVYEEWILKLSVASIVVIYQNEPSASA